MKKILACLAITATLGFGVLAGLSQKHEVVSVKADDPVASGTITVDMQNNCWAAHDESKLAIYFYNESVNPTLSGWSSLVHCNSGTQLAQIPYSLNFEPEHMIAVRFAADAASADWNSTHYNQTGNLDYVADGNIMITNYDTTSAARVGTAYLQGKSSDTNWEWSKYHALDNVHINSRGHVEYFSEITLTPFEEFKFYLHSDYICGWDLVRFQGVDESKWTSPENNNIKYNGAEPLTATFYFDRVSNHLDISSDGYQRNIEVADSSFFANWNEVVSAKGTPGEFRSAGATYECGSYNAFGSFFDGCTGYEGLEDFTLDTIRWKQHTQYIYFQWGCAKDYGHEAQDDETLTINIYSSEDAASPYYTETIKNNTFCGKTMLLKNYIIPENVFTHFNGGDFYMSISLFDGRNGDWGAHIFGNLHANQTHEEVSEAQWNYYKNCQGVSGFDNYSVQTIRNHYAANATLRAGFVFSDGFVEQFETQESFNNNFMLDAYGNDCGDDYGYDTKVRHADKAVSFASYRNGTKMPFNKTGDGLFKGWYGDAEQDSGDRGFTHTDAAVYRFVSRPFRLPANGIVSVKMAGNSASLHLIDFDGGHGDLAWVDCKTFSGGDDSGNIAADNRNTCTMVRHIINFSKYGGRLVQLAIADVDSKDGGWNAVYFDELRANYTSVPSLQVDIVAQNNTSYSTLRDKYVTCEEIAGGVDYNNDYSPSGLDNNNGISDTSPLKKASDFVNDYLNLFRNYRDNGNNFCSVHTSEEAKALIDRFNGTGENGLNAAERDLVIASDDYRRVGATKDNWSTTAPEKLSLRDSLIYIAECNGKTISIAGAHTSGNVTLLLNDTNTTIIIVISLISVSALGLFLFARKRKADR